MRRSFRNVPGVESVRVEYIPFQKRHGTIGELGGLTAKITLNSQDLIDAQKFAASLRNLGINKVVPQGIPIQKPQTEDELNSEKESENKARLFDGKFNSPIKFTPF